MTASRIAVNDDMAAGSGASAAAATMAVASRTLRRYMRSPQLLVTSVMSTVIFIVLFRFIFGGAISVGTVPYADFLIPGMVATSVVFTSGGAAVAVAEDREQGFSDRLFSLPAPRLALLAGRVVGESLIAVWGIVVTIAIGFLVGFRIHGTIQEALLSLALCVVCAFAILWIFICMGLVSANAQAAQGIAFVIYPFTFISSAYVPADTLPGWLQPIAEHQPITAMCNAVRSLALGDPSLAGLEHSTSYWVTLALGWAAALMLVFASLAVTLDRRER